jgi:thioredoxin-like negative regulator of GroEL
MADRLVDAADLEVFQQIVGSAPAAVVHFWASWCEPCKHLDNILAQLASENQSAKFVRVEAEEVADVSEKYDVSAVPFFLFFKVS